MQLNIQPRTIFGKKTKTLRAEGIIPGEIFGHGFENKHVSVSVKEFTKVYGEAGENTIITLIGEEGEKIPALISNVERDAVKDIILSIDFYHVRKDEKIKAEIPVEYIGEDNAAKAGNLLVKILDEIEVEALPDKLPRSFVVDISSLEVPGQSISIEDLKIEKDVKVLVSYETIVATVTEKQKEEVVTPAPETTPEETSKDEEKKEEEKKK